MRPTMASSSSSSSSIRLRLSFDYPPPSAAGRRLVWLLLDSQRCRVVADLEEAIRDRFGFGPRSVLNLFIDHCYLPHTESISVVRDNDQVSVNVDSAGLTNGQLGTEDDGKSSKKKKRRRHSDEEPEDQDVVSESKKKKRTKRQKAETTSPAKVMEDEESPRKRTKKKNKKLKIPKTPSAPSGSKPVASSGKAKPECSSSSSDETEAAAPKLTSKPQNNLPKKTPVAPPAPKATPKVTPKATAKVTPKAKPTAGKTPQARSPSSSSYDSSSEEAGQTAAAPKLARASLSSSAAPKRATPATTPATTPAASVPPRSASSSSSSSDSEEEIKLVIKQGVAAKALMSAMGRGRGGALPRGWGGVDGAGGGPEGRVGRGYRLDYEESERRGRPPSYDQDSLTNHSVTLQNPVEPRPKKDYSTMTLLAAPPGVGQKIAFKLLELTEDYTPQVSEYKEGKILNFDHATKQVELELLNSWQAPPEPGKFDLVYQNSDGSKSVEYAVSRGLSRVTEHWDSLMEPRLVL